MFVYYEKLFNIIFMARRAIPMIAFPRVQSMFIYKLYIYKQDIVY